MGVRLLAVLVLTLALAVPVHFAPGALTPAEPAPNPLTCEGYPEPRVFLESQDWWQPTLFGSEDFGHVHIATCFPRTHRADGSVNKLSGTVHFDVRVLLHDNPGTLRFTRIHLADPGDTREVARVNINETCQEDGPRWNSQMNACEWWVSMSVDTNAANYSGFQEFRFAANVKQTQDVGDTMFPSSGWQGYLDNGKPEQHYRRTSDGSARDFIEGRGWYLGANYTNARLESRLPHVVSGVWEPSVRFRAGSGGITVKRSFASIDASFHHGHAGTVLLDTPGAYRGTLTIDTTKLSDGPHRLFLRADAPCDGTSGNDCGTKEDGSNNNVSTNSGALAIVFHVNNGTNHDHSPP